MDWGWFFLLAFVVGFIWMVADDMGSPDDSKGQKVFTFVVMAVIFVVCLFGAFLATQFGN